MNLAGAVLVRSLQLMCCFVSLVIASPGFWDDLEEGITSSVAETRHHHNAAKRYDRSSILPFDLAHSMTCKRPRNHRPAGVDLTTDVASLGPDPSIDTGISRQSDSKRLTLQACLDSDMNQDMNSRKKLTNSHTAPETWETSADIVPDFNQLNDDQIFYPLKTLPQWSEELSALREFLGLSPDNREPAQNTHPGDEITTDRRPHDELASYSQDSIRIAGTAPLENSVRDKSTQHEHDASLSYPAQSRSFHSDERIQRTRLVPGKLDHQCANGLPSNNRSVASHIPPCHNLANNQLGIHGIPLLSEKKCLLDLEPTKEQSYVVRHAPLAYVGVDLLKSYTKPFEETIDSMHLEADNQFFTERVPFRGVSAAMLQYLNTSGHMKGVIRVLKSNGTLQSPSKMKELMRPLLAWVKFNHDKFYGSIQLPTNTRQPAQREILDWLLTEFFNPRNSLPVTGMVEKKNCAYDESAFGPVQRWLIKYLSSESGGHPAFIASAAIIGIWYKNIHMDVWKSHFKNDDEFWSSLISVSDFAKSDATKYYNLNDTRFPVEQKYIGNFQIHDLRVLKPMLFPLLDRPGLPKTFSRDANQLEKMVVDKLTQLHGDIKVGPHSKKTYFNDLPMVFVEPKPVNDQQMSFKSIRLVDAFGSIVILQVLKTRLNRLLKTLNRYHAAFLLFSTEKKYWVEPNSHVKLIYWIHRTLFDPGAGLPVFGKVEKEIILWDQEKLFTGEVQTYLIDFFARSSSHFEWNQTALSILGYWYKTECRHIWDTHLKNNLGYWLTIGDALLWGLNNGKPMSLQVTSQ